MRESWSDRTFTWVSVLFCLVLALVMIYPFYYLFIYSVNDSLDASRGGLWLYPRKLSLSAYSTVFHTQNIIPAAWISISRTVIGTLSSVICTSMLAYALSKQELVGRRFFSKYFLITMFVSGGLIPFYMMLKWVHLMNTYMVYILPGLIGVFNMLLIKAYFEGLPGGLVESAAIDGAGEFKIFFRIVLPLSMPILATISIFNAVGHWNSWQDNFFYASNDKSLTTLQLILVNLLKSSTVAMDAKSMNSSTMRVQTMTPESVRAAITMVVTVPILIVYPFFQKHFTQGVMLGSVKG